VTADSAGCPSLTQNIYFFTLILGKGAERVEDTLLVVVDVVP
jgi:hypothetical protein